MAVGPAALYEVCCSKGAQIGWLHSPHSVLDTEVMITCIKEHKKQNLGVLVP